MIKQYSLKMLQTAVQCALSLDPLVSDRLIGLQGKVLEIILLPLDINFFIQIDRGKLVFFADAPGQPDTVITSSPLGLIRLSLLPMAQAQSLLNDKIQISGDLNVGLEMKKIFDGLDIDWAGHLARFTGDALAHQIHLMFNSGAEYTKHVATSVQNNISEYIHEEACLAPCREAVQDFCNDVDELSLYAERLSTFIHSELAAHEKH